MRSKVVLFLPLRYNPGGVPDNSYIFPLELLSLAGPLLEAGHEVQLVDASVEADAVGALLEAAQDAMCVGVSALYGYQVFHGGLAARRLREAYPGLPIVWGGWFPSTDPGLLLREGVADVVVRGQGELTFLELVRRLVDGRDHRDLPGTCHLEGDALRCVAPGPLVPLDDLPRLPFQLLDVERYRAKDPDLAFFQAIWTGEDRPMLHRRPLRALHHFTSWGCPRACSFCSCAEVSGRRVSYRDVDDVLDQLCQLEEAHGLDVLMLSDPNFFLKRSRAVAFAQGLLDRGLNICWAASAEIGSLMQLTDAELELVVRSGYFAALIGAESGSQPVLDRLGKPLRVEQIEPCVARLAACGVTPFPNFIVGFPGESTEEMEATFRLVAQLKERHPACAAALYPFWPLPGTPLLAEAVTAGYTPTTRTADFEHLTDWVVNPEHSPLPQRYIRDLDAYNQRGHWLPGGVPEFACLAPEGSS